MTGQLHSNWRRKREINRSKEKIDPTGQLMFGRLCVHVRELTLFYSNVFSLGTSSFLLPFFLFFFFCLLVIFGAFACLLQSSARPRVFD